VDPIDPVRLTRALVDIDSTTGREAEAGRWLARFLAERGYRVIEQPVTGDRFNVFARLDAPPEIVFSTHFECVPPFFASREERGLLFGRGACDAKGILAAQVAAAERLRAEGESRFGLLFVVGEERGSDGAPVANQHAPSGVRYLINGEPTDNRLGAATRGVLRVRLSAAGRAAHSSFPELGESAIDKLLDALMVVRGVTLPVDEVLGRTHTPSRSASPWPSNKSPRGGRARSGSRWAHPARGRATRP
jgi:acetylornithine deacetylase